MDVAVLEEAIIIIVEGIYFADVCLHYSSTLGVIQKYRLDIAGVKEWGTLLFIVSLSPSRYIHWDWHTVRETLQNGGWG